MPPNQDPTPPTTNGVSRLLWGGNVYPRPMRLFCEIDLCLIMVGIIIWMVYPSSSVWSKVGVLLWILSLSAYFAVPGAFLAMGHPWGDFLRKVLERRFAHPRLAGLAMAWFGLIMSGGGASLFLLQAPLSHFFFETMIWWQGVLAYFLMLLAAGLVALAPILALDLFDRRLPE